MKKASDILCALSVIVAAFLAICCFSGFFGLIESDVFRGVVIIISVLIGVCVRAAIEDEHPIAAGVITLLFISSGGFGLISAILLFVYGGQQNSGVTPAASQTESKAQFYQSRETSIRTFFERYEAIMRENKANHLSSEEYRKQINILTEDMKEFNRALANQLRSIENRLNRGVLSLDEANKEAAPIKAQLSQVNQLLAMVHGSEEYMVPAEYMENANAQAEALEEGIKEEIARLESKLALDEEKKAHFESYKKYYEQGIYSNEEYLSKLRQLRSDENINDAIESLIERLQKNEKNKTDLEFYKNCYERGMYTSEEYYQKLKELL